MLEKLPYNVKVNFDIWADTAAVEGRQGLRQVAGFLDEALNGIWKVCCSSRLSKQYGVIYQVRKDIVSILIIDVMLMITRGNDNGKSTYIQGI